MLSGEDTPDQDGAIRWTNAVAGYKCHASMVPPLSSVVTQVGPIELQQPLRMSCSP
jgi:hypothetical protein